MAVKGTNFDDKEKVENNRAISSNVLGGKFIPPDGGWGWMIVVAAGFSNFCILPIIQSFGLLFRDRFEQLGINASQTTTIINVNCAVTSCIGLANGPLFRKYSYRQTAFAGAVMSAVSICALSFAETFYGVLVFFGIMYAAGMGISMSAVALALNTYFKKRRRIATALSWTCTGLGPIIMPQIITVLMPIYGMSGTVLIFGGFALNAIVCSLLLQPVSKHAKTESDYEAVKAAQHAENIKEKIKEANISLNNENGKALSLENILRLDKLASLVDNRSSQRFGSQYLYYDDEEDGAAGIDVIALATPMMSRANDGWFSKKNASYASLASNKTAKKECQSTSRRPSMSLSRQSSLSRGNSTRNLSRPTSETEAWKRKISSHQMNAVPEGTTFKESAECEKQNGDDEVQRHLLTKDESAAVEETFPEEKIVTGRSWYARAFNAIVVFLDLDLLRDPVYVNLLLGITFANFSELNFALLTPFILAEYGLRKIQIATVMSVLAGADVLTRLAIPLVATRIGWENRTFFLVGVGSMAAGRVLLAHIGSYEIVMGIGVLIGAGKALRTIFMALVIPTHVPLDRLPAASGLQLVTSGLFYLATGPFVGWIRDNTGSYTITLHCLNILTYVTIISWTLEVWYRSRKQRRLERKIVAPI